MHTTLQLELVTTAYTKEQLPSYDLPHIALAGRSNVGKSSLINSLAGAKKLAKISSTPGKTRSINFYTVQKKDFILVDLPGYGYAKCSKKERAQWAKLVESFILSETRLKAVLVLIDSRIPPQQLDLDLFSFLQSVNMTAVPILTKSDKTPVKKRNQNITFWKNFASTTPLCFSAKTGMNRDKLLQMILKLSQNEVGSTP